MMRVLVACEFSGVVREAFRALGHDAVSCDLLQTELAGPHIVGDVREVLGDGWDLMIGHPPCTYLCKAGARWWSGRSVEQAAALEFFKELYHAPIPRIAVENPAGCVSRLWKPATQIVDPWMFGDPYCKETCFWLRNLAPLQATAIQAERSVWLSNVPERRDRWKIKSRTFPGLAAAMAVQWGGCPGGLFGFDLASD